MQRQRKENTTGAAEINAQIAAVRGADLGAMLRDAIDALGGIQKVVNKGETVFIKPNMVTLPWGPEYNPFLRGECTKPEIIIAVTEECLRAGASHVIVDDGSQMCFFDCKYATTLNGSTDLVQEAERLSLQYLTI